MNEEFYIFPDTSFKTNYCYVYVEKDNKKNIDIETELKNLKNKWDEAIENIIKKIPDFENDYRLITLPFTMLEDIGLGKFKKSLFEKNKQRFNKCFPKPYILNFLIKILGKNTLLIHFLDFIFGRTANKLRKFCVKAINSDEIIEKIDRALSEKKYHKNSLILVKSLERWKKDLQEKQGENFQILCRDLAWDILTEHVWLEGMAETRNWESIYEREKDINQRLMASYRDRRQTEENLSWSRLLAKHRYEKPKTLREFKIQEKLFNSKCELLDPNLIEFVLTGYQGKKVIVITCDGNKMRKRLDSHIKGIKYINKELQKEIITFNPGYLIILKIDNPSEIKIINIKELL